MQEKTELVPDPDQTPKVFVTSFSWQIRWQKHYCLLQGYLISVTLLNGQHPNTRTCKTFSFNMRLTNEIVFFFVC